MQRRLKPTTIQGYERNINGYILPFLSEKPLEAVGYSQIDDFVSKMGAQGLSNTSVVYVLATLSKMYSYAVKRGYTAYNPLLSYDYPRKNSFQYTTLTQEQLEKLLAAAQDADEYPAILLACHYGLRRGEACGVNVKDIVDGVLHIRRTSTRIKGLTVTTTPKNDKVRCIKLLSEDAKALEIYNKKRKRNAEGVLMRDKEGIIVTPNAINKRLRKHLRELGLPQVRFHDLRHSYATVMMQNGVNPKIVSTVLGHSSVDITLDLYSHCCIDMQDACLQVFRKPSKK
ncbi:MAG: site-specific integrase [Clostridia bacterium]|nr:site-specific integrase [Clostridia bacterium]